MFVKVSQEQASDKKYYVIFLLTSGMDYLLMKKLTRLETDSNFQIFQLFSRFPFSVKSGDT